MWEPHTRKDRLALILPKHGDLLAVAELGTNRATFRLWRRQRSVFGVAVDSTDPRGKRPGGTRGSVATSWTRFCSTSSELAIFRPTLTVAACCALRDVYEPIRQFPLARVIFE